MNQPRRIAIYGAGGLGRMVLDLLRQSHEFCAVAFLDSSRARRGQIVDDLTVVGGGESLDQLRRDGVHALIVAIGDNLTRVSIAETLRSYGFELASAIHPSVSVARSARLGSHLILGPRTSICVNAEIGDHAVVSAGAIIEHDNQLGIGCMLQPAVRLAGGVKVGDFARFGIGACVIPGRRIGSGVTISPGTVVIRDVPAHHFAAGVPALNTSPPFTTPACE